MKHILATTLIIFSIVAFGQKKQRVEIHENIVVKAIAELDSLLSEPNSLLYKEIADDGIKGHYVFDITIREKGFVATVFVVNEGENSIPLQNRLKDIIKAYRFSFKVPKGKSYKFQYPFNL